MSKLQQLGVLVQDHRRVLPGDRGGSERSPGWGCQQKPPWPVLLTKPRLAAHLNGSGVPYIRLYVLEAAALEVQLRGGRPVDRVVTSMARVMGRLAQRRRPCPLIVPVMVAQYTSL